MSPHLPDVFPSPRELPFEDRGSDARLTTYRALQAELESARVALAGKFTRARSRRERDAVLDEAADVAARSLVALNEPWFGTPWEFYGTSEEPGRGTIACGYFVTTLLRDAGVRVQRVRLAQQASEYIVRSLAPRERTWRFRSGSVDAVLDTVRAQPERWFVVGLDLHVGLLLRLDDGSVRFCHSAYLAPAHATCEDAATSAAMQSGYHVVGALFTRELTRRWLAGDAIPTLGQGAHLGAAASRSAR